MPEVRYSRGPSYDTGASEDRFIKSAYKGKLSSYFVSVGKFSDDASLLIIGNEDRAVVTTAPIDASFLFDFSDNIGPVKLYGYLYGDILRGGAGDDWLDGRGGADTLEGGAGRDTASYENSSARVDVDLTRTGVQSGGDAQGDVLSGIENLVGSAFDDFLTGDNNANELIGGAGNDRLKGGGGDDILIGGLGADDMQGGTGNDTYYVDDTGDTAAEVFGNGLDQVYASVSFALGTGIENLTLTGTADLDGTGNALDNALVGNAGNNVLDGGAGNDVMEGGAGDDTYVVGEAGDRVVEAAGQGRDTVRASVSYTLGDNVEDLHLTGSADLDGTGNALANVLTGNAGRNRLDGGAGVDTMQGGAGDDTYVVDDTGDRVIEALGEGIDTVLAAFSYTLSDNVENLTLTGSANLDGTGNALDNVLVGNTGRNVLTGGAGNDTLDGGGGVDRLIGGVGDDTYVVATASATVVELAGEGIDTVRAAGNYTLGANLENLVLTGAGGNGTGNGLANLIFGNAGNNVLDGAAGADRLIGGAGNDTYVVDNAGDVIVELAGGGNDLVRAAISYTLADNVERLILTNTSNISGTGNGLANTIVGSSGANTLAGLGGADILTGGAGRDTFAFRAITDSTVAASGRDTITDFSQADTDRIDLRAIDANSFLDGDQAFGFIGTGAFTNAAGQLRYEASGANTLVTGDINGDAAADFAILLTGQIALTRGDFLL